jgi:polyferredoxin
VAWILRAAGAPPLLAGGLALGFGLVGVALMLLWSRQAGVMAHCVAYCPVGLLATWLGRVSPFRLRIDAACDDCMRCRPACRYAALSKADIARRRPGSSCTLCGDCLDTCPHQALHYRFAGLGPARARALFITLAVALHAATLGLARI